MAVRDDMPRQSFGPISWRIRRPTTTASPVFWTGITSARLTVRYLLLRAKHLPEAIYYTSVDQPFETAIEDVTWDLARRNVGRNRDLCERGIF